MFSEACKSILLALVNPDDASKDSALNEFYENVHIPDILETPGILAAHRFVSIDENVGKGKYLSIFEFNSVEAQKIWGQMRAVLSQKQKIPGHSFVGVTPTLRGVFRRFMRLEDQTRPPKNITGVFLACFTPDDAARLPEMHLWSTTVHLPDLLSVPGFHAVDRFEAADSGAEYQFLHLFQLDSEDPKAAVEEMRRRTGSWQAAGRIKNFSDKRLTMLFKRKLPVRISVVS